MKKTCISKGWLVRRPGEKDYAPVDLPHDGSISLPRDPAAAGGAHNGFFQATDLDYVKFLRLSAETAHAILDFDGAYMASSVSLNADRLAFHPHGYTPFLVDLSDRIHRGDIDKLRVHTSGIQPSTRWYSGSGLYRDVFLWTGGPVRIEPRATFVTTESLENGTARLRVTTTVSADRPGTFSLRATLLSPEGESVLETAVNLQPATSNVEPSTCNPNLQRSTFNLQLPNASPWSPDSPTLYTLVLDVMEGDTVLDTDTVTFGIRTISFSAEQGFLLNGVPTKMRGGCIHHDHGVLGSAAFPAAEARKIRILREAGYNAIRTSHYPPSLALLEACDRQGVLVMDEAFDMWTVPKTPLDYHLWFADWWQRDIGSMVARDRNHPCVVSYSIGNEIYERWGNSDGYNWAHKLATEFRRLDPTRPVTSGVCGLWDYPCNEDIDPPEYTASGANLRSAVPDGVFADDVLFDKLLDPVMDELDIVGYNYQYERYATDHEHAPKRVIWGSETHALRFYDSWQCVKTMPWVLGDFTWTAFDNLGEAGTGRSAWARDEHIPGISLAAWPWRSCFQGDHDLCGYRRPQSFFREAVWLGGAEPRIWTTHPTHHGEGFSGTGWHWYDVLDTWTFDDEWLGKPVRCEVYTDADEIEFVLNGRILGRVAPEKAIAAMDVPYERGRLVANAYKGGALCGTSFLETAGASAKLAIVPERDALAADRRDLAHLRIAVVDAEGRRIPDSKAEIVCSVEGGEFLGVFSGDPKNLDQYTSDRCHAFEGRALAVVRASEPGSISITVSSPGLASATCTIQAS